MPAVRGFFVDNLNDDLQSTLDAVKSSNGAIYPICSVVQLVPTEVMLKRQKSLKCSDERRGGFRTGLVRYRF